MLIKNNDVLRNMCVDSGFQEEHYESREKIWKRIKNKSIRMNN